MYFSICDNKHLATKLSNYLSLFLNKSFNFIFIFWIKCPYKKYIIDNMQKFCNANLISDGRWNCSSLWLAQWQNRDSGNMLPCENGGLNFAANLIVVALKWFDLTAFALPNYQLI